MEKTYARTWLHVYDAKVTGQAVNTALILHAGISRPWSLPGRLVPTTIPSFSACTVSVYAGLWGVRRNRMQSMCMRA